MAAPAPSEEELLQPADDGEWEAWLADHHADAPHAWLKLGRKGCAVPSITHAQALDTALCFGWIDAQVRGYDEQFTLRRFTPRTPRSTWSRSTQSGVSSTVAKNRASGPVGTSPASARWKAAIVTRSGSVRGRLIAAASSAPTSSRAASHRGGASAKRSPAPAPAGSRWAARSIRRAAKR